MVGIVFALGFVDVPDVEVAGIGVCDVESVSYTHLTLPTKLEV